MISIIVIIICSYIVGSIPTSIIAGKLWKGIDIRNYGSGNAGATNVFRVLGWKAGVIVGIFDIFKGLSAPIFIAKILIDPLPFDYQLIQIIAGVAAVFGHIWTIFAGFKGGKGVLTAAGMILGLAPVATLICIGIWGIIFFITRYVSLGSICAAISLPIVIMVEKYVFGQNIHSVLLFFTIFIGLLIIFTHRSNIKRLINGTENRFKKT
ncbi:acyl-phosphate glycerol 3-phosphate acyltransferase [candidate division KSB1 bacterium]|nr:MAG: acyl-phosphate glycerol 3-phosphate acyltransferase [candidate division KSB1 bacterium]